MLTVFTSLACSPRRTSRVGEDCRPRTTWRPLTLAGSPALPPLRLTGGVCHADWTVPRQDANSPFSPCVCHSLLQKVFAHTHVRDPRESAACSGPHLPGNPVKHMLLCNVDALHQNRKCFFSRRMQFDSGYNVFDSGFNVMTINKILL